MASQRLIIGLDYGTTFTGITYGVVKTEDGKESVKEEFICSDWPKGGGARKVPSEISYSTTSGTEHQWGFNIAAGSLKLIWTKVELDQQERLDELVLILKALDGMKNLDPSKIREEHGCPSYPAMDTVDIVADYLTRVREYVKDNPPIRTDPPLRDGQQGKTLELYLSTMPIDLVVTVPADWSDQAKDRTFRAISKAGFNQKNFARLQDIILVAEPEAAAIYILKTQLEIEGDELIVPGDCFVLCDAGGGTVDLISYRVKQLVPSIQLEEAAMGAGAKCGSTFIDRRFIAWLEQKLGPEYFKEVGGSPESAIGSHTSVTPKMQAILDSFQGIKHSFSGLGDPVESFIALPNPLNQLDDQSKSIVNGELVITDRDLQDFFEPSIDEILDMIKAQIGLVRGSESRVKHVFLTGGLAQSEYLFKIVEDFTRLRGIRTKRPGPLDPRKRTEQELHCLSAVMRGAVLKGLEKGREKQIFMRKCRRYYGVLVSEPFSSFKHLERDSYIDPFDGQKKAQGQVDWLLKRGDALLSNKPKHASVDICRKFGLHDPRIFRSNLLVLDDDDAPQRYAEIPKNRLKAIELVYDLSEIPHNRFQIIPASARGQPYLCAHLRLEVRLETHLEFKVMFDERELKNVVVNYD